MLLFALLGAAGLGLALALGRYYGLPLAWAALAVYAGMLSSLPFGALKWNPTITFSAFRFLGALLVVAALVVLVRYPGVLNRDSGTRSLVPIALVGIPLSLAVFSLAIGLWRGNNTLLLVGDVLRLALTGFAIAFGLALAGKARTDRLVVVMSITMLLSEAIVGVIYLAPSAVGLPGTVRTGGGLGAVLALGLVGILSRDRPRRVGPRGGSQASDRGRRFSVWPRRGVSLAIVALVLFVSARSLTRGTWVGIAVALVAVGITYVVVWRRYDALRSLVGLLVILTVLVPVGVAAFGGIASSIEYVGIRLAQSDEAAQSSSAFFRGAEIEYTTAHLDSIPLGHELGAGAGATYYYPPTRQVDRHQVHFLVYNFRFRSGIVGMLLYMVWTVLVFALCFLALSRSRENRLLLWATITVLVTAVQSLAAQRLIGEAVPAFALGIMAYGALATARSRRSSRHRPHTLDPERNSEPLP